MITSPLWQYVEMHQVGTDYSDIKEVEAYDMRHTRFRDIKKENTGIIEALQLQLDHQVIEFGSGTGAFAIQAAPYCSHLYAVDVSLAMLEYAQMKAKQAGITNVSFHHGGFLTYAHTGGVDAVVSSMALHHLPDFWKAVALNRINSILRPGGKLFIADVVFAHQDHMSNISKWIAAMDAVGGKSVKDDVEMHIREEYSTFDWIMEGLLSRSGFEIQEMTVREGVLAQYLCKKTQDSF